MNLKTAIEEAKNIVEKNKYFSIKVEYTRPNVGEGIVEISAYVADLGWTRECGSFSEMLTALADLPRKNETPEVSDGDEDE
jgi:hypothetical protein